MTIIEAFDLYVRAGFRVIPLYPCSKKPVFGRWQDKSEFDPERCRQYLISNQDSNLGLLLGEIVDVEGDSPEANESLEKLIGDIPHPKFRSSRSIHHLFLNPDPHLTRFTVNEIEFRGWRHQSVIPPSRHYDGTEYTWLKGTKMPVPEMPAALLELYQSCRNSAAGNLRLVKPGHVCLRCPVCREQIFIHRRRLAKEKKVFRGMGLEWTCRKCRSIDLRRSCKKVR